MTTTLELLGNPECIYHRRFKYESCRSCQNGYNPHCENYTPVYSQRDKTQRQSATSNVSREYSVSGKTSDTPIKSVEKRNGKVHPLFCSNHRLKTYDDIRRWNDEGCI